MPKSPRKRAPRAKAAKPNGAINVRALRESLGLTQKAFAEMLRMPHRTALGWEYGRAQPPPATALLLKLLAHQPTVMLALIKSLPP